MPKKILILDDEEDILDALKGKLERAGYTVTTATNGFDGLAAARRDRFDLVITDVVMPGMDGFQFFKEFKKVSGYAATPVIIVSAHASMEDTFRVFGVQDFLTKPVDGERIIKVDGERIIKAIERLLDPSASQLHRKILILGTDMEVVASMVHLLNDNGHKAAAARDESEFLNKALAQPPEMMIIDVLLPKLLAHEMIKAIRCFSQFKNAVILTYTSFSEKQLTNVDAVEQLKFSKNQCMSAGASDYIGRFSRLTFMDVLSKY
jgi:two-component system, chemotaxis family, chemotaxis protein CheY